MAYDTFEPKKVLFIDCEDLRWNALDKSDFEHFIRTHSIELLIVANYDGFELPEVNHIWMSTQGKLDGFENIRLSNLDFEEFLLFDRSNDPKAAFSHYLKNGNAPAIYKEPTATFSQNLLRLTFKNDLSIFKTIAYYQGQSVSAHFLYTRLKEHLKISKDRLYDLLYQWEEIGYIHLVPKYQAKRAAKKLFFYNFNVKSLLYVDREFPKLFENMVYLEIDEECFYIDPLGFYLPQKRSLILAIPFGDEVRIQIKIDQVLQKNRIEIDKIEVVTVATSFTYEIGSIRCEVVPFYEWALGK